MTREEFLLRIQRICFDIESLINEYGGDKAIALVVLGCVDEYELDVSKMSALYHYNIADRNELISIVDFIDATWDDELPKDVEGYKSIDDLLDGLDIELE